MSWVGAEVTVGTAGIMSIANANHPTSIADDVHPPVSPKRGSEVLFLDTLDTQTISATALARQIHRSCRVSSGATTTYDDDFQTAYSQHSLSADDQDPFLKDALLHSRDISFTDTTTTDTSAYHDSIMTTPDVTEKVYEAAKGVWSWGKGVMLLSPFLGLAEGIAGKMVTMAGSSLEQVDGGITHQLHSLDGQYLNPAIDALVKLLMGTVSKTEEIIKPILQAVMKPLLKNDAEAPELTTRPPALTTTTLVK